MAVVEAVVSTGGVKIVDCLWAPIERQFGYMSRYHDNFANLSRQVEKLTAAIADVDDEVAAAERNLQTIKENVADWVARAKAQKAKADIILGDCEDKVGKGFLKGWCLSLKSRYWLGRKVAKKAQALEVLITDGKFDTVARRQRPLGIVSPPGSEVMQATKKTDTKSAPQASTSATTSGGGFESRLLTMRDVMEALKDDNIRMIRICGMGGVGKTTMVNEVGKRAREKHMFEEIVMAELTANPDVGSIQSQIAESLGLKLEDGDLKARADLLRKRLNVKDKKILVILDNVWRRRDVEDVGIIPLAGEDMGYRILLTSRSEDVCADIRPQKTFRIGFLSNEEALMCFQTTLGTSVFYSPHMYSIAEKIVKECGGLPLAIVAIARTLVNRDEDTWKYVLGQLEQSGPVGEEEEYARVNETLQLSYNSLKSEEIKDIFLLCCLFPEGFDVPIEDLVRYGVGLRLFKNINNMHYARIRAHAHVETLQHANLLLRSDKEECVKMHDVVRDFALSTASKGLFMVRYDRELKEWPVEEIHTRVSLQYHQMHELPDGGEYPKLKLLKLVYGYFLLELLEFPDNFYKGMGELNVLAITGMGIFRPKLGIPQSFQHLTNLRTLSLNNCDLGDGILINIGNLKKLEVLSCADSSISELPRQIENLIRLRLLDLSGCRNLRKIPAGVLSRLIRLEELYMIDTTDFYWAEVKSLKNLVVVQIRLPCKALPADSLFENLKKFNILIGDFVEPMSTEYDPLFKTHRFQDSLKLAVDRSALAQPGIKSLLRKTEVMHLQVKGLKTLDGGETEIGDSSKLKTLALVSCNELVYLVNRMPPLDQNKVFLFLESLCLHDLNDLEDVYHAQHSKESLTEIELINVPILCPAHQHTSFGNLRVLDVRRCRKLEKIFSLSIARGLVKLERLQIVDCEMMKEIVSQDTGDEVGKIEFPDLKYLKLTSLPNMVAFCQAADVVELPQLVQLELDSIPQLTSQHSFFDEKVTFTSLEDLSVKGMNFPLLWSDQFPAKLRKLVVSNRNELVLKNCDSVEVVFDLQQLVVGEDNRFETLNGLKDLSLYRLPRMAHVWKKGPQGFGGFKSLTTLEVKQCESIKYLFSPLIAKLLVELRELRIHDCKVMEEVVCERDEDQEHASDVAFFPKLQDLDLWDLPNLRSCFGRGANSDVGSSETHHKKLSFAGPENSKAKQQQQFPAWSLCHLNDIYVNTCHRLLYVIPSNAVARLRNLTRLEVSKCDSVVEIFEVEGLGGPVTIPQSEDVLLRSHERCVLGFPNLKHVFIETCNCLEYLFRSSTVESLVHLEYLRISDCKMMKEVIVKEDDDEVAADRTSKLVFPRLDYLYLERLPKLGGICLSEKLAFEWPSLEDLKIAECEEMMIFTRGHSSTPKLKQIRVNSRTFPVEGDLNTTLMNSQQEILKNREGSLSSVMANSVLYLRAKAWLADVDKLRGRR